MTALEGFIGLIASVCAIIGALILVTRYLAKRFDKWTEVIIENSSVMRHLTARVVKLENAIERGNGNGTSLYVRLYARRSPNANTA